MKHFSLVTGAAGLLGEYHSQALINLGHNILMTDIDKELLKTKVKNIKKKNNKQIILYKKLDVTSEKSLLNLIKYMKKNKFIINILINNAAIDAKVSKKNKQKNFFENFNLKNWNKEIEVGLTGTMLCSKIIGSEIVKAKVKGIILNIASDLSIIAPNQNLYKNKKFIYKKPVTYSVIKHGIIGLTKYLATYWCNNNIRVNALSPGSVLNNQPYSFQKEIKKLIPLNRMANKEEYIGTVMYLCSDASSYMTGQNIVVDGGRSIW